VAQVETDSLVWWIFRPGETIPAAIGKLPRTPLDTEIARREAAALRALQPYSGELGIPRLLFEADLDDGRFLFLQSGSPGRPLSDHGDHFAKVLPWLERFQAKVAAPASIGQALRAAVARCGAVLPDATAEERQLLEFGERLAPELERIPAAPVHGDFWTGNVLEDGGRMFVIDWSNYRAGSPIEDLHNFAAAQAYDSRGDDESRMESMWRVFFADHPLMHATRAASERIVKARGIPAAGQQALFVLFLMVRMACPEFSNHGAWRRCAVRYLRSGAPEPFTVTPGNGKGGKR
jgi:hypothetical protein